ncbi:MAG TPA: sialate O-acetylesterase [Haliscomenobacter sp.]|uniref:sialate O-acetylesterase n=1 Tax=Haliscomenobacter sp. TaxID=2717303 RepID=UPI002C3E711E|nr:sialate O-acetylesterase [Haliscomenobacter sp.]HOY19354.1 sialate O-acetylesterase [Haliscomenobacter sp.]
MGPSRRLMPTNKLVLLVFLLGWSVYGFAQIRLPRLISDGMVLQREQNLKIWGWASAQENISLKLNGKTYRSKADAQGNWNIALPAQPAGGPFDIALKGKNELLIRDVYFGDVWICAGQSNMVLPMERVKERYMADIEQANYPAIRNFFIPTLTNVQGPQADLPSGKWEVATPQNVMSFGAASYFFAKTIYDKYQVPIGLINASVGGTPIEAWISESGLQAFPNFLATIQQNKDTSYVNSLNRKARQAVVPRPSEDKGMLEPIKWYDPAYVPKNWRNINVPGYWEDQGIKDLNGVVWYRKEIDVPASMCGVPAKLFLGRIVDADFAYVNGQAVGNITYQYPPRRYTVPAGVLKPGKNTLVVRVINQGGKGGFVPDKPYFLSANGQDIDLKGDWLYKVGDVFPPFAGAPAGGITLQNQPSALFNAMTAPLVNHAAKGFLWYQGETNAGNPKPYYQLLPALIQDWRKQWNLGDLPFITVQLANFMEVNYLPSESTWAVLRDAQFKSLAVPNTGLAVAIDLGEWNDIHPLNKKDVGIRMALAAQRLAYGDQNVVHSGPQFERYQIEGDKIRLYFKHTGTGMISKDGEQLACFAIAGADKRFVWAKADIQADNTILVSNTLVSQPLFVRYAWADNPADANLYNREGLPASPFRTDE